ncbi:MAG: hypothetical protein ABIQ32_03055 [Sphingomicrobium sp.]
MSRTITAMYDSRSEAETARERLLSTGNISNVDIHQESGSESATTGESSETGEHRNWFEKLFLPDDDRETYGEGLRRGHFLLTAQVDNEEDADRICDLLEETGAVDVEERSQSWRNEGWQPETGASTAAAFGGERSTSPASSESSTSFTQSSGDRDRFAETGQRTAEQDREPFVDDQRNIGRRELERGGPRVRSYVREPSVDESQRGAFGFDRDSERSEEPTSSTESTELEDDNFGRR